MKRVILLQNALVELGEYEQDFPCEDGDQSPIVQPGISDLLRGGESLAVEMRIQQFKKMSQKETRIRRLVDIRDDDEVVSSTTIIHRALDIKSQRSLSQTLSYYYTDVMDFNKENTILYPGEYQFYSNRRLPPFALFCCAGIADDMVDKILSKTKPGSKERHQLLESRQLTFRLSPLLLAIYFAWYGCNLHDPNDDRSDYEGVVETLLNYGFDPFARDILGQPGIHYACHRKYLTLIVPLAFQTKYPERQLIFRPPFLIAAGFKDGHRANTKVNIAQMCLEASKYSHLVNRKIRLKGLTRLTELNGKLGWCGGFAVRYKRCAIYFENDSGAYDDLPTGFKPSNVEVVHTEIVDVVSKATRTSLIDMTDRFEQCPLFNLISVNGERVGIALFLLKCGADLDIGCSIDNYCMIPRLLSISPAFMLGEDTRKPVNAVIQ